MYERKVVRFTHPPVAEVALALHTLPVGVTSADISLFWSKTLASRFPKTLDQPPAQPSVMVSDNQLLISPIIIGMPTMTRQWFLSEDETRLVQMQQDRLVVNWRRLRSEEYPHYQDLRADLVWLRSAWQQYCRERDLPAGGAISVEVTYINHIATTDSGPVLRAVSDAWPESIGQPTTTHLEKQFAVPIPEHGPATLQISLAPAAKADGTPVTSLNLTFRGTLQTPETDAFLLLDIGHNQITNTFFDVITDGRRSEWGGER